MSVTLVADRHVLSFLGVVSLTVGFKWVTSKCGTLFIRLRTH
jgi:hypothetical protein